MSHAPPQSAPLHGPLAARHLSEFAGVLFTSACSLIAAAAFGAAVAVQLRRRELAWTWALLALLPLPFLALLIATEAVTVGATTVISAVPLGLALGSIGWGFRAQLEDRRAGGDREAAAAERRGLLDGARRRRAERASSSSRRLAPACRSAAPTGASWRWSAAAAPSSGRHVLIPGATGAGKTTSLAALLVDYVARSGFGAVVLEAKTDRTLRESAERRPRARGTAFHLLSPAGPSTYDPLAHGSVDERSERLIAVESWGSTDAGFYRQAASPFLRLVLRTLDRSSQPVDPGHRRPLLRPRRAGEPRGHDRASLMPTVR